MSLSTTTIDRIVANVLNQLSTGEKDAAQVAVKESSDISQEPAASLSEAVITAELLTPFAPDEVVQLLPKAIITPAANDLIREKNLRIVRGDVAKGQMTSRQQKTFQTTKTSVAIVRHTPAMQQAIDELGELQKELLSCPDDAAKFAISEVCRSGATTVLLFAEQTHRAACLANRNDRIKAVAVKDATDVKEVRKQLRANVWCIDPTDRSYFEIKNLLKVIRS